MSYSLLSDLFVCSCIVFRMYSLWCKRFLIIQIFIRKFTLKGLTVEKFGKCLLGWKGEKKRKGDDERGRVEVAAVHCRFTLRQLFGSGLVGKKFKSDSQR